MIHENYGKSNFQCPYTKFSWHTAVPIHLRTARGSFLPVVVEMGRACPASEASNTSYLDFYRKCQPLLYKKVLPNWSSAFY